MVSSSSSSSGESFSGEDSSWDEECDHTSSGDESEGEENLRLAREELILSCPPALNPCTTCP